MKQHLLSVAWIAAAGLVVVVAVSAVEVVRPRPRCIQYTNTRRHIGKNNPTQTTLKRL
jgi:hypothetical protein